MEFIFYALEIHTEVLTGKICLGISFKTEKKAQSALGYTSSLVARYMRVSLFFLLLYTFGLYHSKTAAKKRELGRKLANSPI